MVVGRALTNWLFSNSASGSNSAGDAEEEKLDLRDLSRDEQRRLEVQLKEDGIPSIEHLKSPGGRNAGRLQLRVDKKSGEIYITPRDAKAPGQPPRMPIS